MDQRDLFEARAARDTNLETVLQNAGVDWQQAATEIVRDMAGQFVTGEDIRLACLDKQVAPHHHNAWGGFINKMVKRGVLRKTGFYRQMKQPASHARETKVYQVAL